MLFGVIIYNVVCAITCMIVVSAEAIGDLILACVYIPFLGAMFFLVYRRLYKAAKSGSSLSYFGFFVGYTVQIIISILATIGLKRSGFMGIVWTVSGFARMPVKFPLLAELAARRGGFARVSALSEGFRVEERRRGEP